MSLFRRCKHTWEMRARRTFNVSVRSSWEHTWEETGDQTVLYYVCSTCQRDKTRTVYGEFTLAQAKGLFPKP